MLPEHHRYQKERSQTSLGFNNLANKNVRIQDENGMSDNSTPNLANAISHLGIDWLGQVIQSQSFLGDIFLDQEHQRHLNQSTLHLTKQFFDLLGPLCTRRKVIAHNMTPSESRWTYRSFHTLSTLLSRVEIVLIKFFVFSPVAD